jgi:hypothetical protein
MTASSVFFQSTRELLRALPSEVVLSTHFRLDREIERSRCFDAS